MTFRLPLLIIGVAGFVAFIATGITNAIPWVVSAPIAVAFLSVMILGQIVEYFQTEKPRRPPSAGYPSPSLGETQLVSLQTPRRIWTYLIATSAFGAGAILFFLLSLATLSLVLGSLAVVSLLLLTRQIVSLSQQAEVTAEVLSRRAKNAIDALSRQDKKESKTNTRPDVSADNRHFEGAPMIRPQSFETYSAYLSKGDLLSIEAGADDWIRVELVSLTESAKLDAGKKYDWERGKEGKNLTVEYEARRNGNWRIYVFNLAKTPLEVGVTLTIEV